MGDSQQENNEEKGKNKDSYYDVWSMDNSELLLLLMDAINRGLRDIIQSLDKRNVDRIIYPSSTQCQN